MRNGLAKLNELSWDYRAARVLQVANKLDIFTTLAGKEMSADKISHSCGTNPVMTEKLLIGCVALGLLKKKG